MAIELVQVSKSYGDRKVLDLFSENFPEHETSVIVGPSGCGKTTLLRLLMGLEQPDSGLIHHLPEKISAVFQEERLCPQFSAVTNVRMVTGKMVSRLTIEQHLIQLGLGGSTRLPVRSLSGGMQRRVSVVRAMLADSELVLLDEPFKGLDTTTKQLVMNYVKAQTRGRTLILVTHEPSEVSSLASQAKWVRLDDLGNNHRS